MQKMDDMDPEPFGGVRDDGVGTTGAEAAPTVEVVVLTGPPGVGKSTIGQELARQEPRCAHVEADILHQMIISGAQWPSTGTPESERQLDLRTHNTAMVAANFARAGFWVVIDEVLTRREQLAALRDHLGDRRTSIVGLIAGAETIQGRETARQRHAAANYPGVEAGIRALLDIPWIDTNDMTVTQTVRAVRQMIGW
jgi:predicted kinase